MYTIYHNPNCTKSKKTLATLQERGVPHTVIEYLKDPLSIEQLDDVFNKLGQEPQDVVRSHEQVFQDEGLGQKTLSRSEWLQAIIDHPILLERPIVIKEDKALICRPAENVFELLD